MKAKASSVQYAAASASSAAAAAAVGDAVASSSEGVAAASATGAVCRSCARAWFAFAERVQRALMKRVNKRVRKARAPVECSTIQSLVESVERVVGVVE